MLVEYKDDLIIISLNMCSRHDIAENLLSWRKTTITQSLTQITFKSVSVEHIKSM